MSCLVRENLESDQLCRYEMYISIRDNNDIYIQWFVGNAEVQTTHDDQLRVNRLLLKLKLLTWN